MSDPVAAVRSANETAQEWERRQVKGVDHRMSALPTVDRTLGRLTIFDREGDVVDSTVDCHLKVVGDMLVAVFDNGDQSIYRMAPGDYARFERVREGE